MSEIKDKVLQQKDEILDKLHDEEQPVDSQDNEDMEDFEGEEGETTATQTEDTNTEQKVESAESEGIEKDTTDAYEKIQQEMRALLYGNPEEKQQQQVQKPVEDESLTRFLKQRLEEEEKIRQQQEWENLSEEEKALRKAEQLEQRLQEMQRQFEEQRRQLEMQQKKLLLEQTITRFENDPKYKYVDRETVVGRLMLIAQNKGEVTPEDVAKVYELEHKRITALANRILQEREARIKEKEEKIQQAPNVSTQLARNTVGSNNASNNGNLSIADRLERAKEMAKKRLLEY